VFRVGEVPRPAGGDLLSAWDLRALRAEYQGLMDQLEPVVDKVHDQAIPDREALVVRVEACARWRTLAVTAPGLPAELLPSDWPQRRARELFVEVYNGLGPAAERRGGGLGAAVRGGRPAAGAR